MVPISIYGIFKKNINIGQWIKKDKKFKKISKFNIIITVYT